MRKSTFVPALAALTMLIIAASVPGVAQTASVTGLIQDDTSKPLASANVTLLPRPPAAGAPPNMPGFVGRARSGANGTFSISSVPSGNYEICVDLAFADWLDTCAWAEKNSDHVMLTVASGPVALPPIRLTKGVRVRVAVADPTGALGRTEVRPHEKLQITIGAPGYGHTFLPVVANSASGRTYEMLVPRQRSLKLRLSSQEILLADQQGRALSAGGGYETDVRLPASGAAPALAFSVTGAVAK